MLLIGLTGGIASGKSTVARLFAMKGVPVLDADLEARQVLARASPLLLQVRQGFGDSVCTPEGDLDRKALANLVFRDPQARERLNRITHPAIIARLKQGLDDIRREGKHKAAVVVAPLLFEAGLEKWCDRVIVVWASEREQVRRLMLRDNLSEQEARLRVRSQAPLDEKRKRADWVVDSEAGQGEIERQVENIWQEIVQAAA
jgi:dephospho-CoA kinase